MQRLRTTALLAALAAAPVVASRADAACSFESFVPFGGTVVRGTTGKQTLVIDLDATGRGQADLDCNGDGDFTDAQDRLDARLDDRGVDIQLGGNDTLVVNFTAAWSGHHKKFLIVLGTGTNNVQLDFGSQSFSDSSTIVDLIGGTGNDAVTIVNPPALVGSGLTLRADLGLGNDSVSVALPSLAGGAQANLDLGLGAGANSLSLDQGSAAMSTGAVQVNVEGGPGVDTLNVVLNAFWGGASRFRLGADLGAGNDRLNLTLFKDSPIGGFGVSATADVKLTAWGGTGNDMLSVVKTGAVEAVVDGRLDLNFNGGPGNDPLSFDLGGSGLDLLGGTLRLRADGGLGSDTLALDVDTSPSAGTAYHDISVTGGAGTDVLSFAQVAASGAVFLGPSLLDGGSGVLDRCAASGSNPPRRRGCEL